MRGSLHRSLCFVPLLAGLMLVAGCATSRLHKQDFEGRRIAATAAFPPKAIIHNEFLAARGIYPHAPSGRPPVGPAEAENDQVLRLQAMLDAAAKRIDVAEHVAREALVFGADRLGASIANSVDEADYVLDLRVYHYGLYMRSYRSEANFYLDAELVMRERATDEVVWKRRLNRIGNYRTRLTGAEMAHLTEADLAEELEKFADLTAERMSLVLIENIKNG